MNGELLALLVVTNPVSIGQRLTVVAGLPNWYCVVAQGDSSHGVMCTKAHLSLCVHASDRWIVLATTSAGDPTPRFASEPKQTLANLPAQAHNSAVQQPNGLLHPRGERAQRVHQKGQIQQQQRNKQRLC